MSEMNVIDEAFENEKFIKLLQKNILRRQTCIETCEYFKTVMVVAMPMQF